VDLGSPAHRRLLGVVAVLVVASVAGVVLLWPGAGSLPTVPSEPQVRATIVDITDLDVRADLDRERSNRVAEVTVRLETGPMAGAREALRVDLQTYPELAVGDPVTLSVLQLRDGGPPTYRLADFQRTSSLAVLAAIFVGLVLLIGRTHGLRSLLGLSVTLAIVVRFVVPAILAGRPAPLVALVAAVLVMVVTLYLVHGVGEKTTAAVVGTSLALTITVALGAVFVSTSRLTGFTSDDALLARALVQGLDLQGLVLAGLIIAALGVLDDVTVTQASTVFALRGTDPDLTARELLARAMVVGRDHIASVVNTLVLAYVGASLSLFVVFAVGDVALIDQLNAEALATEVVQTIVGSIGLVLAVPMTTALAAWLAVRTSDERLERIARDAHVH
jgi:uncharacterized membrane protein